VKPLRSGSLESLRERNRLRVIDALRERGAVSRADVARQTGLSRSTVSSLVAELQAEGLVVERELAAAPRGPEGGRPPVLIALDESAGALVGIDFGHRHARVAVSDLSFTVLAERTTEIDVDTAGRVALDLAAGLVCELLDEAGVDRARVLAAGIGIPGPLDRRSGLIQSRGILPSMDGIDTVAEMQDRLDLPVHLDNDANIGALGESTFGAGEGAAVMAYLRLSAGIGAGLVIGGRPFRGAHGVAGEIGHVLVDSSPAPRCASCCAGRTAISACRNWSRWRSRATRGASASSTTPAASSGGRSRTFATSSTRTWSWWAGSSRWPVTCCWSRCARRYVASPSRQRPRTCG
jgi:predicted NBD/HSP70 family sugar kinase